MANDNNLKIEKNKLEVSKNVPELRFQGFLDAWEQRKLEEVTERVHGNDGRMDLPTLTISAGSGWLDQRERFSNNIAGEEQKNYTLLHKGELSYNHGNSKLAKYGAVFELRTYEEALVPRVYHSFKTTDESSSDFIEYMFATKRPDRELGKLVSSGARMDGLLNINFNEFMGINVILPSANEQKKISEFLRRLDLTTTLHQRKLDKLKRLKQGYLQQLFPKNDEKVPSVRFANFDEDWELRKLDTFGKSTGGTSIESEFTDNGKYKVISIGSYSESSKYTDQGIRADATSKTEQRVLNKDDLTMILNDKTSSGNIIGRVLIIDADDTYVYNQRTERIEVDKTSFVPRYIYQLLNADRIRSKIIRASQGNTQIYVNWTTIKELSYIVPVSKNEQRKIADYFGSLDCLITLHQSKLDNLKSLKQALLQKMFI